MNSYPVQTTTLPHACWDFISSFQICVILGGWVLSPCPSSASLIGITNWDLPVHIIHSSTVMCIQSVNLTWVLGLAHWCNVSKVATGVNESEDATRWSQSHLSGHEGKDGSQGKKSHTWEAECLWIEVRGKKTSRLCEAKKTKLSDRHPQLVLNTTTPQLLWLLTKHYWYNLQRTKVPLLVSLTKSYYHWVIIVHD